MTKGINILEHKSIQLRTWVDSIAEKRGVDSTLTIRQIYEMLDFLDEMEKRFDDIILKALED